MPYIQTLIQKKFENRPSSTVTPAVYVLANEDMQYLQTVQQAIPY